MRNLLIVFLAFGISACSSQPTAINNARQTNVSSPKQTPPPVPIYTYEVVNSFPHDPKAFTQGFFFLNGFLYESTGEYGESTIRKVDPKTGRIILQHKVPDDFFGEGATIFNNKIYQLTWREHTAFVYDLIELKPTREHRYSGEGWGLTHDENHLIMSDGTHVIRFVDPETFNTVRTITVNRENGYPLMRLNELEYVKGEIWANIWHSEDSDVLGRINYIARIDPASGKLLGYIDLGGISPDDTDRDSENTLNGIAYDAENDRIFITGKRWKKIFEIIVKPKQ